MKPVQIPLEMGTYGATTPTFTVDKTGAIYTTTVGNLRGNGPWGTRLWKIEVGKKAQQLFFAPGNISLIPVDGKMMVVFTDPSNGRGYNAPIFYFELPGFIPAESAVSGTTVNINDAQVAEMKLAIQTATTLANRAVAAGDSAATLTSQVNTLANRIDDLENQIRQLEAQKPAQSLSKQEIADLVWSKIWDMLWILRQDMSKGTASDPNSQGWINDLTAFIKKVR